MPDLCGPIGGCHGRARVASGVAQLSHGGRGDVTSTVAGQRGLLWRSRVRLLPPCRDTEVRHVRSSTHLSGWGGRVRRRTPALLATALVAGLALVAVPQQAGMATAVNSCWSKDNG